MDAYDLVGPRQKLPIGAEAVGRSISDGPVTLYERVEPCPFCGTEHCTPEEDHLHLCKVCETPLVGKQKDYCSEKCTRKAYYLRKKEPAPQRPGRKDEAIEADLNRPVVVVEAHWEEVIPYAKWGTTTTPVKIQKYAKGEVVSKREAIEKGLKYTEQDTTGVKLDMETK